MIYEINTNSFNTFLTTLALHHTYWAFTDENTYYQ